MTKAVVGVVIINWNGYEQTAECVQSVLRQSYSAIKIFVVDNGSDQGEGQRLQQHFPQLNIKLLTVNTGFANAANEGARLAIANGCEFVFFLNNDAIAWPTCVERLVECAANNPTVGLIGPTVNEKIQALRSHSDLFTWWTHARIKKKYRPGIQRTIWGCALFVRKKVFETCGYMRQSYFAYFEDRDFCKRARNRGFKCLIIQDVLIEHTPSSATGGLKSDSPLRSYLVARNRIVFYRLHGQTGKALLLTCGQFLHSLVFLFLRPRPKASLTAMAGALEGSICGVESWPLFPDWIQPGFKWGKLP